MYSVFEDHSERSGVVMPGPYLIPNPFCWLDCADVRCVSALLGFTIMSSYG